MIQATATTDSQFETRVSLIKELKACGKSKNPERGRQIHQAARRTGDDSHAYVASTLINMYAKCGCMRDARDVFDSLTHPNVVCWNALIFGYADNGESEVSLELFSRMGRESCTPDARTFIAALKACAAKYDGKRIASRERGEKLHLLALAFGCDSDIFVQGTLVDMYAKCGSMDCGRGVFESMKYQDVVSWTALILGYADNGEGHTALELFSRMGHEGCAPDVRTFVAALKACTDLAVKDESNEKSASRARGAKLHLLAATNGWDSNMFVQATLMDMLAKCGIMVKAREIFESMKKPDVVAWTALILGYADNGEAEVSLKLFSRMKSEGCGPNAFTFSAVLKACAMLGALELGKGFHAEISSCRLKYNAVLANSLLDLYAKCGSLLEAEQVFDSHATKNLVTWTTLMTGYSYNGDTAAAFSVFDRMLSAGLQPDGVTFYCVLTACSHAGLVEKGKECFETMSRKYELSPKVEHYNCLIDLLGRANQLEEAMAFLRRMPSPNSVTWLTVLGACRRWKNLELGRLAFECLMSLDMGTTGAYVLMANLYGSRGMWADQARLQAMRLKLKIGNEAQRSWWVNQGGAVQTFDC